MSKIGTQAPRLPGSPGFGMGTAARTKTIGKLDIKHFAPKNNAIFYDEKIPKTRAFSVRISSFIMAKSGDTLQFFPSNQMTFSIKPNDILHRALSLRAGRDAWYESWEHGPIRTTLENKLTAVPKNIKEKRGGGS